MTHDATHSIGPIGSEYKFKPSRQKKFIIGPCFVIVFLFNEKIFLTTGVEFMNAFAVLYFNWQAQKSIFSQIKSSQNAFFTYRNA